MVGKTLCCFAMFVLVCQDDARAINLHFLNTSPVSRFNEQDMQMLQAAFQKAMNEGQDGAAVEWKNDKTTSGGTITPVETFERQGAKCRRVRFTTEHRPLRGESEFNFCRGAGGTWRRMQ